MVKCNMKIKFSTSLLFALIVFSLSCKRKNFEEITLSYDNLTPFDSIALNDVFDVYLTQDSNYTLKVTGSEDVVKEVNYTTLNNTLTIDNAYKQKWLAPKHNKVKLYISSNRPKRITTNQTCYVETTNPIITDEFGIIMGSKLSMAKLELNCNTFYFWNIFPCGGKLTLFGNTNRLILWNFAIMSVDAGQLTTGYALVENNSKGDCEVMVTDKLEYSIYGTGNIYLHGHPNEIILKEKTSSGQLIELN